MNQPQAQERVVDQQWSQKKIFPNSTQPNIKRSFPIQHNQISKEIVSQNSSMTNKVKRPLNSQ